jgi:hypothetical protein
VWAEYQAAARRLDAARQAAAKVVAEQSTQLTRARAELADLQTRITLQRNRLDHAARSMGAPLSELADESPGHGPAGHLIRAAAPRTPAEAMSALIRARGHLDKVDAMLTTAEDSVTGIEQIGQSAGRRNAIVYGAWAAIFAIIQLPLILAVLRDSTWAIFALCGLVTPAIAFGLGWVTVAAIFKRPGIEVDRTPLLGALISLGAAAPMVLMLIVAVVTAILG